VCLTLVGCSGVIDPVPTDLSPRELASAFASAWVTDDFDTMSTLVCPDSPPPWAEDAFPFQDASVTGPATREPSPNAGAGITSPAPDFSVPFEGTDEAGDATGTVDVTFGTSGSSPCVQFYGLARDLADE
jgi:hypothetical protein